MNRKWSGGMLAALIVLMSIPSEMAYARPKPERRNSFMKRGKSCIG